jgi:DedD protein
MEADPMAENEGEAPRFDPKHRIIGAIILVALAVIFIPMILDESNPPPEVKDGAESGAKPAAPGTPETKVVVTPVAELGPGAATAPLPAKPAEAPAPVAEPAAKPEPAAEPAAAAKPAPAVAEKKEKPATEGEKAAPGRKTWIVQVGVYSHADNARRSEAKLREHGYAVMSDTVALEGGKATRLRVGPYKDKAAAEKARGHIQKLLGESVLVRSAP